MNMKEIKLEIQGKEYIVAIEDFGSSEARLTVNGKTYTVGLKDLGQQIVVENVRASVPSASKPAAAAAPAHAPAPASTGSSSGSAQVLAPLPGLILNVMVKVGDRVNAGQKIMVMEAMKMENDINAGITGTVKTLNVKNGDNISEGDVLAIIE
jgi:glutaconyl-CoA/methylmalonyl-CoA decarboxylase subunit gamma